ncbi:MAG: histidine kinase [Bacteroidia bacterium]|nr:histidine kinase [Bacteroidia bacterium]
MRFRLLCCLLLTQFGLAAGGDQTLVLDILGRDRGFDKMNFINITQDKAGFLWLSTQTGLIQYGGFLVNRIVPGNKGMEPLVAEFFYQAYEDKHQNLWLASRNGLYRLSPDRKTIKGFFSDTDSDKSLPNNRIFSLLPFNDSILFLACDRSGIVRFNMLTQTVSQLHPASLLPDTDVSKVWVRQYYYHNDTCIFLRTSLGYFRYNPAKNVIAPMDDVAVGLNAANGIANLFRDRYGYFWFTDAGGKFWQWLPGKQLKGFIHEGLRKLIMQGEARFFEYDEQQLLVSTMNGNFLLDRESFSLTRLHFRSRLADNLSNVAITAAYRTTDNNLFLAFLSGHLAQVKLQQQVFTYKELLQKDDPPVNVAFILDDTLFQKRYITSYHSNDFYVEDLRTGRISYIPKPWPGRISANKIIMDKAGRIWASQNEGVVEIDRRTGRLRTYRPDVPTGMIFDIVETSPGKFYVGSFRSGLYYFEPDKGIFRRLPETGGWINTQVFSLHFDNQRNQLWIGTVRNGLFRLDIAQGTFTQFMPRPGDPRSIGGDWVRSFVSDNEGNLWMTADPAGMSCFDHNAPENQAFRSFSIANGLPSNHVSGLVKASDGKLWITSLNGIASFDPETFEVKRWDVEQGAYDNRFHYANLSLGAKGEILAGTERGYLSFIPGMLHPDTTAPRVYLTNIEVTDASQQNLSPGISDGKLQLAHDQNNISIGFAVVNFNNPERNKVFYQLQGSGKDWQTIGQTGQIYFSGMAPGHYVFRLRAQNGDGVWSANELRLPITIIPPYWQTWWFRTLVLFAIVALIIMAFRYRLNNLLRQNRLVAEKQMLKTRMETEMATLEMKALRAQMNPHFIFNCLNSINRFIIVNDNDTASEYLTRFSRLIRMVLDNSRSEKISLDREIETLRLYIGMEKLRFVDKFDFEIHIDEQLDLANTMIQPMMVQPYVENAIWHGLMPLQDGGKLLIRFTRFADQLLVSVEDNGIGRKRSQAMKTMQRIPQRSHGMKVTAERLSLLSSRAGTRAEIIVTDLTDEYSEPRGTRVDLILPLDVIVHQTITDSLT